MQIFMKNGIKCHPKIGVVIAQQLQKLPKTDWKLAPPYIKALSRNSLGITDKHTEHPHSGQQQT